MTLPYRSTTTVARLLNQPYYVIFALLRNDKIPHPPKDDSGSYCWGSEDIARASAVLDARRQKQKARLLHRRKRVVSQIYGH